MLLQPLRARVRIDSGRVGRRVAWPGVLGLALAACLVVGCSDTPTTTSASLQAVASDVASPPADASSPDPTPLDVGSDPPGVASPGAPTQHAATSAKLRPGDPNAHLTPGATNPAVTQKTIKSTICVSGWTATVRPSSSYTTALKRLQIDQYGYSDRRLGDYEEDHLISLELGGATRDPRNLWPEPYTIKLSDGRSVGARIKDKIENRLHSLVCSGQISLAKAQREIRLDWITAWFALDGEAPPPAGSGTSKPSPTPTPQPVVGSLKVTVASVTSPVARGASATLVVRTKAGASCAVVVLYKSGPSKAQGLEPTHASVSGSVRWIWTIGSRTTLGAWPITVTCSLGGKSASAHTTIVVH